MILSDIAIVRTAPVFRDKAPQESLQGNVRALTIRDLVGDRMVSCADLTKVLVEERFLNHCLKPGEVVIASRGDYYPVWLFEDALELVCPVGQFNIITAKPGVDPRYLAWYLQRQATQSQISHLATGTAIRALNKNDLLSLEVEMPSVRAQARIADLYATTRQVIAARLRLNVLDRQEAAQLSEQLLREEVDHA